MVSEPQAGPTGRNPDFETNLTQAVRLHQKKPQLRANDPCENCFNLTLTTEPVPQTLEFIGQLPKVTTEVIDGETHHKMRSDFGKPKCASITFDAALVMRMFAWPRLRMLVLFALAMQTRPLTQADITIHASIDEDGKAMPTDMPTSHRCRYTILSAPVVANKAMPEDLLRVMTPDVDQVVHQLRLLVADAGFEIDPAIFASVSASSVPTLAAIAHELAALQAEGIVGPLDPKGKAQLNGRLVFNGNPAVRTLLPEMVRPAPGNTFSVNPAHAVDPNKAPPEGCFKSGKRKADSIAAERRKRQEFQREIEHDAETITRLHTEKRKTERERDEMMEIALDEALKREAAQLSTDGVSPDVHHDADSGTGSIGHAVPSAQELA